MDTRKGLPIRGSFITVLVYLMGFARSRPSVGRIGSHCTPATNAVAADGEVGPEVGIPCKGVSS